jgi:hypothetical protein
MAASGGCTAVSRPGGSAVIMSSNTSRYRELDRLDKRQAKRMRREARRRERLGATDTAGADPVHRAPRPPDGKPGVFPRGPGP